MSGTGRQPEIRSIVATRFGQMHARLRGMGSDRGDTVATPRPLVLLHMSPRSSQMYVALQESLRRPSVALDRLGYGFSDPPVRPLDMTEYAAAALEALDRLGLRGRLDVLGMHTGALEAIEMAHLAPQRITRLGLIALPCFDAEEKARGLAGLARITVDPAEDGSHLLAAWRGRFQYREPPWELADVQRRLVDYLLAERPGAAYEAVFRYDGAGRLRALRVPVTAFAPRDDL